MHLVFITNHFPPTVCGIGDYTFQLANAMQERGHQVTVICRERKNEGELDSMSVLSIVKIWDKTGYQTVLNTLENLKPDWVFFQYEPYSFHAKGIPIQVIGFIRQLSKQSFKTMIFFHEVAVKWYALKLIPISIVQSIIAHMCLYYAHVGATSMRVFKNMFLPGFRNKIQLQPIGSTIFTTELNEESAKEINQKVRGSEQSFWIGCFGGDGPEKGYEILLAALKTLPFANLLFIGSGKNIKRYARENNLERQIHVTGITNTEGVNYYLKSCDVFAMVHADIRGGLGFKSTSLAAGFNVGLPILGYQGKITETDKLIHGENCWLVKEATPDAFEKAILYLYEHKNVLEKLKTSSQNFFNTQLRWDVLAAQYESWLNCEKSEEIRDFETVRL